MKTPEQVHEAFHQWLADNYISIPQGNWNDEVYQHYQQLRSIWMFQQVKINELEEVFLDQQIVSNSKINELEVLVKDMTDMSADELLEIKKKNKELF